MRRQGCLTTLRVENLAIVDRAELVLGEGLTVLTGETGAGKSILVDALGLLLGGRADLEMIRAGAGEGVVEAMVELGDGELRERFVAAGIDVSEGQLVIRRVIARSGRGRVTINGQLATVAMLGQLTRGLIDISGQHEHVSLLDSERHLELVDAYGGLSDLVARVGEAHGEVQALESALSAVQLDENEKARREDFLRFQLDEIQTVDPKAGELEGLEQERRRLSSAGKLAESTRRAEADIYSADGAMVETLGRIQIELVQLARLDQRLEPLSSSASSALAELQDLAQQLARYARGVEADPSRLEAIEDRVEALKKLTRKHGGTIEQVLAARAKMEDELDTLAHDEARRADLQAALEEADAKRSERAVELSAARGRAAKALEKAVQTELTSLSMAGTILKVELVRTETIGARGAERAEILIAPNAGEPLRPLAKTASGGELSRVMLAFKRALADRDLVSTYVFDEVDSGIGGAVADVLGRKLLEVARDRQVLCITHLPQIAAYGEQHFKVIKSGSEGRTVSRVVGLGEEESVEELARMLGGLAITERTRHLAREMREHARAVREGAPIASEAPATTTTEGTKKRRGAGRGTARA